MSIKGKRKKAPRAGSEVLLHCILRIYNGLNGRIYTLVTYFNFWHVKK